MNRNLTLILSAVIVVILLGIWIYLVFFADRSSDDQAVLEGSGGYAEFDTLGGDTATDAEGGPNQNPGPEGDYGVNQLGDFESEPPILRQLTARNVIGYQEVTLASSSHIVFMESGVGHLYRIDPETGVEERISATTIPDARQATFSTDGRWVVVKTGEDTGLNPIVLGWVDMESKTVELTDIENGVGEFTTTKDNSVLYTTVANNSVVVKSFDFNTKVSEILFTAPFREARVLFGPSATGPHYFFPKTSFVLEGFVYEVNGNTFTRLPIDGFGFTAAVFGDVLISSHRDQADLVTNIYNTQTDETTPLDTAVIPEKCVAESEKIYCALPSTKILQHDSINRWLQGVDSFADNLWLLEDTPTQLIHITNFSGRRVDVVNGSIGPASADWYFQNKIDNSLWIYELSRLSDEEMVDQENI